MNNELIKIIKRCYTSLVDESGNSKEKADCYLVNTSDNNIKIIKEIVGIIIRSDNVSIETKIFISNDGWSIKDTNLEINRLRENAQRLKREMVKPLSYNNTTLKIKYRQIKPYTPKENGKVERSHRKDQERFYYKKVFYSLEDLRNRGRDWRKEYNNFPMRPLGWLSPNEFLKRYKSQEESSITI